MPAARDAAPIGAADRARVLARAAVTGLGGGAGRSGAAGFAGAGLAEAGAAGLTHLRAGAARLAAAMLGCGGAGAALGTAMIAWHLGHLPRLPASSSRTLSEC